MTNLVLLQPFLEQLLAALLKHGTGEFHTLELVKFALLQEDTEVLKNR